MNRTGIFFLFVLDILKCVYTRWSSSNCSKYQSAPKTTCLSQIAADVRSLLRGHEVHNHHLQEYDSGYVSFRGKCLLG